MSTEVNKSPQTDSNLEGSSSSARASPGAREFRFVNNSASSMGNPTRARMKPAFKATGVTSSTSQSSQANRGSLIIEQTFDQQSAHFVNSPTDLTAKYVFQMNVKRPPGRPRKHPIGEPKVKRPQGRPRKYPIEVTGSTVSPRVQKRPPQAIAAAPSNKVKNNSTPTPESEVSKSPPTTFAVDSQLLEASVNSTTDESLIDPVVQNVKRGRGRPKKADQPVPKEDHDVATSVAAAAVAAHLLNNDHVSVDDLDPEVVGK